MSEDYIGIITADPELFEYDPRVLKKKYLDNPSAFEVDDTETLVVKFKAPDDDYATLIAHGHFFDSDFCQDGTMSTVFSLTD